MSTDPHDLRAVPDHECTEGYYAAGLLAQERAQDAAYAIRAWSRGFAWLTLCAALGATFTAISQGDWLAVAAGLTAVVAVFLPRIQSRLVYEVIKTEFMRRKLLKLPEGEIPAFPIHRHDSE